jgi:protocatechuate 3,4-dioxygenase beta subunit
MRKGVGLTVATGLVAVVLGLGVVLSRKHEPSRPAGPERPAHGLRGGTGVPPSAPAPLPKGSLRITGVVLGDSGPLAGVRVSATRPEPGQTLSELRCGELLQIPRWNALLPDCMDEAADALLELVLVREGEAPLYAESVTAPDGTFTLDGLPAGTFALWAGDARGAGLWPDIPAGTEGLTLTLGTGLYLDGQVVDTDGGPLAGVQVTAVHAEHTRFFDTRTEADGRYRLGPLPLSTYRPAFAKEGFLPKLGQGTDSEQVVLHRPLRLAGRIIDQGRPVPGVPVRAQYQGETGDDTRAGLLPDQVATTDAEGRFTFDSLSPASYRLRASHGDRHALHWVDREQHPSPEVVLELGTALLIEGTLRDEAGNPIADVGMTGAQHDATSDAAGHYALGPMEPGQVLIRLYTVRHGHAVRIVESGPGTLRADFTLETRSLLEGVVVDSDGRPLPGATVELMKPITEENGAGEPAEGFDREDFTQTDEAGRFILGAAAPGAYHLEARALEGRIRMERPVTVPAKDVRIVLPRKGRVSGTLTDEHGAPCPGAEVRLWRQDTAPRDGEDEDEETQDTLEDTEAVVTDARGRFDLWGLKPGRFFVEATRVWGGVERSASRPVELREDQAVEVALRLEAGWTLSGIAVDAEGNPVSGVQVQPSFPSEARAIWRRSSYLGSLSLSVTTGPDGRFTFQHLQVEELALYARGNGHRLLAPAEVRKGDPEVRLVLERLGRVHGRLIGPDGAPITRFRQDGQDRVDPGGVFTSDIGGAGTLKLALSAKGLVPIARELQVRAGQDVDLGEVRMTPGRRVAGRVVDARTNKPIIGVRIAIEDHPEKVRSLMEGAFVLPHVDVGPRTLFVESDSYRPWRTELGAGDVDGLLIRLEPATK